MKNRLKIMVGLCGVVLGFRASAADVEVAADVASAYVFRGATRNEGPVLQPAVNVRELPMSLSLGVWGNLDLDDYDGRLEKGEFSEIDFTVTLAPPASIGNVIWEIGYTEYTYPATKENADREIGLSLEYDGAIRPRLMMNYGLAGALRKAFYSEAGVSCQTGFFGGGVFSLGLDLAWLAPDEGGSGFSHYQFSGSLGYGMISATLAYIGQWDDDVLPDAAGERVAGAVRGYDVELVGSVGIAAEF